MSHSGDRRSSKDPNRMSSYKQKPERRDPKRHVLAIRRDYYDFRMRLQTVVAKWKDAGMSASYIEDVVFYRTASSVLPQDVAGNWGRTSELS